MTSHQGIRERNGRYYINYVDESGKRVEVAAGPCLKEARVILAERKRRVRRIREGLEDSVIQDQPVGDVLPLYLAELQSLGRTDKYVADTKAGILSVVENDTRFLQINRKAVAATRTKMLSGGRSIRTINKVVGNLRAFLRWAEESGHIARDPIGSLSPLRDRGKSRSQRRARHALTTSEARDLLQAADARGPVGSVVALCLGTGFRLMEALSVRWKDYGGDSLSVTPEVAKSGIARTVHIRPELSRRIDQLRREYGASARRLPGPDDPILLSPNGKRWEPKHAWREFERAREAAGLPKVFADGGKIDYHALRHTYGTWLARGGIAPQVLMKLLGHATISMVMRYVDRAQVDTSKAPTVLPDLGAVKLEEDHA